MFAKMITPGLQNAEIAAKIGCSGGYYPSSGSCRIGIVPANGICRAGALGAGL
ncbi:MAG: hypothetical protein HXS48_12815 [Theionarchaea archaeon]|nr:hypothetical protein [Theionarchaea archaeon]